MKIKKRRKKEMTDAQKNCERKDFIRLHQKIGWADFDELQVNDSKGTNSQVTNELGRKGWFVLCSHTTSAIKLTIAGTEEW